MTKDKAIVLKEEVSPVIAKALEITIKGKEDMVTATDYLSKLNKIADRIKEEKDKVLGPLNEARKAEMARWKPVEIMYEKGIEYIRHAMSDYQTLEVKRQREEEAKLAARIGEGKGKIKFETAMRKMNEIEKPEDNVVTDSGSIKFRETKVLKIVNEKIIPREYLLVDERKVTEALKAGVTVAGCELELKIVPVNSR